MLPVKLVGSVVLADGSAKPFALDVATGGVGIGEFTEPDADQRRIAGDARAAAERQVARAAGIAVREVRLGQYCCYACGEWIDVAREPERWSAGMCLSCSLDRASDLHDEV